MVARQSLLFEEFLQGEIEAGRRPAFADPGSGRKALLHGHCHQKALAGTGATVAVLRAAGFEVAEVDTGCCGMAGSFGFEREHYELSVAMARRRLVPAITAAGPDVLVCAPGTSCRQQIAHTTGRQARHPAELLWDAVAR
jgi:Fe-S oxidoreductase